MRHPSLLLAGVLVAGGLSGLAQASGPSPWGCAGMGPMGKMGRHAAMKAAPAEHLKQRLDFQKYQLKITPEQEALWNAFAEKALAEADKRFAEMQALAAADKLTAPERMARREKLLEERLAAMKAVHESFLRLYDALTPEQKAIADQQTAWPGGRRSGRLAPPAG